MADSIFPTPFKLTTDELLLSSAATILFQQLQTANPSQTTIADLCTSPQYGHTDSARIEAVGPRFVRITDIKGGTIDWDSVPYCFCNEPEKYLLKPGDILVARAGSVGKSFLVSDVPETAVFASYMIRLCAKPETIPDFVYWFFQTQQFWLQVAGASRGSAMGNINGKMLAGLVLPVASQQQQHAITNFLNRFRDMLGSKDVDLPDLAPPFQNAKRIVARVDALAGRVEEARGLRRAAVKEAEAVMGAGSSDVFRGIAAQHPSRPIGETFTIGVDLLHPTDGKTGTVHFIGLQHIESHTGKKIGEDILLAEELQGRKFKFVPGEIIYGYLRPYLNKVWIADCEGLCSVDQYVIRPKRELIDTEYLAHFMRSTVFLRQAIEMTHNLLLPRLRTALLESIPIPMPPPDEQRQIAAYLNGLQAKVDELRRLQAGTQKELDALMPSILAKAFAGEL